MFPVRWKTCTLPSPSLTRVRAYPLSSSRTCLVLPGTDGFELMRGIPGEVPVIFLSGRGRGQDIARAFEMGAADYVVKPFSPTELVARVRAALRRRSSFFQRQPYVVGDLTIDFIERTVSVAGRPVPMTPTEYKLLYDSPPTPDGS